MRSFLLAIICLVASPIFAGDVPVDSGNITPAEFGKKINAGVAVLGAKGPISTEDAIMLVRLSNTLLLSDGQPTEREKEFGKLMWGQELVERLKAALGTAEINTGMGHYFPKHDLHWGGSGGNIRDRDRFIVAKTKKQEGEPVATSNDSMMPVFQSTSAVRRG
jgi:hypothetical protein